MTTLIAISTPIEGQEEAQGRYLQGVKPLLIGAGGRPVKRLRVTSAIAGAPGAGSASVTDFDSAEAISALFASDAYQALVADRDKGFSNLQILVSEELT